jgi:hypothetical protein
MSLDLIAAGKADKESPLSIDYFAGIASKSTKSVKSAKSKSSKRHVEPIRHLAHGDEQKSR